MVTGYRVSQLQEVWRFCEDRNIRVRYGGIPPVCDTPIEVKGMWWGVLEKGQCLQGNIQYYGDYNNTSYSYTDIKEKYSDEHKVEIFKEIPSTSICSSVYICYNRQCHHSLSYATRTCKLFPICTSLTWLQAISFI